MSALGACDHAVGADYNVTVKVHVNFQRCQDDEIEFVDISALVERVCVLGRGNFKMVWVRLDGLDRALVEILGIDELVNKTFR